jgi:hypothetical protein
MGLMVLPGRIELLQPHLFTIIFQRFNVIACLTAVAVCRGIFKANPEGPERVRRERLGKIRGDGRVSPMATSAPRGGKMPPSENQPGRGQRREQYQRGD